MSNTKKLKLINFLKGFYFHAPILTLYFLDNGIRLSHVVYAQIFYSVFSLLSEVPTGIWADRKGQKKSLTVGLILEGMAIGLIFFYPQLWFVYLAFAVRGIAGSFRSGSDEALLYESVLFEKLASYKKHFAQRKSGQMVGFVLSTLITALVIEHWGASSYPWLFLGTTLTMSWGAILSLSLKDITAEIRQAHQGKDMFHSLKILRSLLRSNKTVLMLFLLSMLLFKGYYFIQMMYQPYFIDAGVSAFFIGSVLSFGTLLSAIIVRYAYRLEKYFSFRNSLLLLFGAMGVLYIAIGVFPEPIFLVCAYVLLQGIFDAPGPLISSYLNDQTPTEIRSTTISGISIGVQLVRLVMRLVLGFLVGVVSLGLSFQILGGYIILAVIAVWFMIGKCGCLGNDLSK